MKKRLLSLLLALTMALSLATTGAWAAGQDSIRVTVTIANQGAIAVGKNNTLMARVPVTVTDRNGDGKFTYDEAMAAAHKAYYEKGEAGFAMKGNSCEMLWGNETTSLGFYRNNTMTGYINGESVEDNDDLTAFVYQDQKNWSDQYCFFDQTTVTVKSGESLTINLKGVGFDENWNTVSSPVKQAGLGVYYGGTFRTRNVSTDANGNGTISFYKAGTYVLSAKKDGAYLVPPVCIVTVTGQAPPVSQTKEVTNAISTCVNGYQSIKYTKPTYEETTCSFGSEWVMLARLRALKGNEGWTRKSADISHYLTSVKAAMKSKKLSKDAKINDIERVIITLTALGYDASNFNGQNLTAWLYQNQKWDNYSPNLMIWSLIALDSGNYTAAKGYREGLIAQLVKYQHTSTGGFFFSTAWPADDVDMTAMAMIALAPYKNSNAKAKKMYNAGWKFIQSKADDQYNYGGDSYDPCSTNAYVVIAKCATGQTGGDLDATVAWMLKNYLGKKGFNLNGEYNGMSTYQGLLAMDAYQRASAGATKLFDVKWPANPITVKNVTKTASTKAQTVKLGGKAKESAKLSYKSSSKYVKVDKKGKVTIAKNFVGKATITVTASATKTYQETVKKVTVTVNPAGVKLTGVKNYKGKKLKAYWKKNTKVTGYQVQYSTSSKFKSAKTVTVKGCKNTSKNITKLTKNKKYYVRVRTYKTVGKVNYYSGWSNTKSITIKK
ncbi:MAG: hypothetical protein Q4G01_07410 [Eubacteriales bacterium]|nr:hypothetical protein [Eubacteriales bacterium]